MLQWLADAGHDVTLFAFDPSASQLEPGRAQARAQITALGVRLVEAASVTQPRVDRWRARLMMLRRTLAPRASDFMTEARNYRAPWESAVAETQPDALWLYTTEAVALAHGTFRHIPRLASVVDLDHEARRLKRAFRPATLRNRLRSVIETAQDRILPDVIVDWFKGCDVVVEHAHAAAQWLRQRGVAAHYLPNPLAIAPLPAAWSRGREELLRQTPIKRILMVGHLRGIATRAGLRLLVDEIIPALERHTDLGVWEIHIVGGGELPPDLHAQLAQHPRVRLRGFVADLQAELQRAHLSLVAVNEPLGFRTRLVEAFAYGSPCVAHASNQAGMPELAHGQNALLARSGTGLAAAVAQLLRDDELRQCLEMNARRTYEEKLSASVVMNEMCRLLNLRYSAASVRERPARAMPLPHGRGTVPTSHELG